MKKKLTGLSLCDPVSYLSYIITTYYIHTIFILFKRCCPLNLIISETASPPSSGEFVGIPAPQQQSVSCPSCVSPVRGIKMLPLELEDLERAVELRKQQSVVIMNENGKRVCQENEQEEAESSFLLLSHDRAHHRTGRWSTEEVDFVDFIIQAFDQGTLCIPHGVKLNDLLGEVLMCKSSRLTKKMKNAKLSTRSYTLNNTARAMTAHECMTLSNLQERFLQSITSESCQLELRFNLSKLWRTHFSNLCLQVGYELLDARDWIATLEKFEGKASEAEDVIRKARRRRMSLALSKDVGEDANAGVFIGGMPARDANMQPPSCVPSAAGIATSRTMSSLPTSTRNTAKQQQLLKRESSEVSMSDSEKKDIDGTTTTNTMEDDDEFLAALEFAGRSRLASEDMDFGLIDDMIVDPLSMMPLLDDSCLATSGNCGPFLEGIAAYMEANQIPFQYADVWVPSFMGEDGQATSTSTDPSKLRLFPAGHATRSDMDATVRSQLNEFGSYSAHFSFAPGHGLPGK